MTDNKDVTIDVNDNVENILEVDMPIAVSDQNNEENDVNDLLDGPIDYGEFVGDDNKNKVIPDVNDNVIADVEGDIHVVEEVVVA